ncbi:MAG: glycoside hydrolase [Bacteroidetes bacterium QS_8_68_28]|nr:MAG: glycoside hydrolase [Bacteroidetes bacterium QS_8_68_28]
MRRSAPFCRLLLRVTTLGLVATLCTVAFTPALSGCASSDPATASQEPSSENPSRAASDSAGVPATRLASALRAETRHWEGTPYRRGGTTRRGVDCSGFMQRVFENTLDVQLSRSTRSQVQEGEPVPRSNLRAGDLVFFRPGGKGRHVGVYVGDGEFAHASTSAGPTISPLEREYWQDTYWTARRVVRLAPAGSTSASDDVPARPSSERASW